MTRTFEAREAESGIDVGPVEAGTTVVLRYRDDVTDDTGADRNLWVSQLSVGP